MVAHLLIWFNINLIISRNMSKATQKRSDPFLSDQTGCVQLRRETRFITESVGFSFLNFHANMEG